MTSAPEVADTRPACGPGLLESVGWTIGYLVVQTVIGIGLILGLILFAFDGWPAQLESVIAVLAQLDESGQAWLGIYVTGGAMLLGLFVIVPAVAWRLRPAPRQALGTDLPGGRELILLSGVVMPLAILSDELYRGASQVWEVVQARLAETWPAIAQFGRVDTIDLIQNQTAYTAYPMLLVIVGVGPAIGEELVFRGVIGRGLVNRLGVIWGVGITSVLFAVAHGKPAHAISTLPIGVFLHWTYLTTRTIWAPILVHFLTNGLSVTMMKFHLGTNVHASWGMLTSAAVYVIAIAVMLWQSHHRSNQLGRGEADWSMPAWIAGTGTAAVNVVSPRLMKLWITTGVLGFTWAFITAAIAG